MYHTFFIHSSVDGHLGCFHVLAVINSAAMNNGIYVSFSTLVSADAWIKKLWYIYTMVFHNSAIKRNSFESVLRRWMNLGSILQSEVSQKEKDKYHILMHIYKI